MAVVTGPFPYDVDNLLGGRVRVLFAPETADLPEDLSDIFDMLPPHEAQGDWTDFGATSEASSYARSIDSEGYDIQQASGAVLEEITDIGRSVTVPLAEIKPENLQIVEEAAAIDNIAGSATAGAQKAMKIGSFADVTRYRIAFVAMRSRASGVVTVDGENARGRFVGFCLYNCTISADESEISFEKGSLASAPVTFTAFPEGGEAAGEEYGVWFFEDAGDIDTNT